MIALAFAVVYLLLAPPASASETQRLLLVDSSAELFKASKQALAPWGIDVVQHSASVDASDPKQLCSELGVDAVAWTTHSDS